MKGGAPYLLLLEVEEVGRRHLRRRRPCLPGPGVHVHASIVTGGPVARRLGAGFLHHDFKICRRKERE